MVWSLDEERHLITTSRDAIGLQDLLDLMTAIAGASSPDVEAGWVVDVSRATLAGSFLQLLTLRRCMRGLGPVVGRLRLAVVTGSGSREAVHLLEALTELTETAGEASCAIRQFTEPEDAARWLAWHRSVQAGGRSQPQ
jgi:hypothetical protein